MRVDRRDLPVRFFEKIQFDASGCWLWTGALASNGYGSFSWRGHVVSAHRFSYTFLVGEIPDDLTIDHLCRTKRCVNPMHFDVVTNAENVRRAVLGDDGIERCRSGHVLEGDNLVKFSNGRRRCRACRDRWNRTYVRPSRRKAS